jgi:hypothetical protein
MIDQSANSGNAGDVLKHAILAWVVRRVVELGHLIAYTETHAGCGRYVVGPDYARGYLDRGLPDHDDTPAGPYFAALRAQLVWAGSIFRYPGSPLIARHQLGDDARHSMTLHETDHAACESLAAEVPGAEIVQASAISLRKNPFIAPRSSAVPVVLVDPFGYSATGSDPVSRGWLNRKVLQRVVGWICEAAGDTGPALLLVWSHGETTLAADLRAAAKSLRKDAVFASARIERGHVRTPYHLEIMGLGDVGRRVIKELPAGNGKAGGWADSPLLRLWNLQIVFPHAFAAVMSS